jgi:hypothetical protein
VLISSIALGEPCFQVGVELVEDQELIAISDLIFELFFDGAIEPLTGAPSFGHVGRGVDDLDIDRFVLTGSVKASGLEAWAVIDIQPVEQAECDKDFAEAESEHRKVFVKIIPGLDDIAAEVVDEGEKKRLLARSSSPTRT